MDTAPLDIVKMMCGNPVRNYILPGLVSSLLTLGKARLFEATRPTEGFVTPHSHRFDFACCVLRGSVQNRLYWQHEDGCEYQVSTQTSEPGFGYRTVPKSLDRFRSADQTYEVGDWYCMVAHEIHSITFSSDAAVLFLEGPEVTRQSVILEPHENGRKIPIFERRDWMFECEAVER